jgi:DNA-damage-inducible protein J
MEFIMSTVQIASRVDLDIKEQATEVVKSFGLDLSTAIRMFVTQIAREKRIPLEIDTPQVPIRVVSPEKMAEYERILASDEWYTREEIGL